MPGDDETMLFSGTKTANQFILSTYMYETWKVHKTESPHTGRLSMWLNICHILQPLLRCVDRLQITQHNPIYKHSYTKLDPLSRSQPVSSVQRFISFLVCSGRHFGCPPPFVVVVEGKGGGGPTELAV